MDGRTTRDGIIEGSSQFPFGYRLNTHSLAGKRIDPNKPDPVDQSRVFGCNGVSGRQSHHIVMRINQIDPVQATEGIDQLRDRQSLPIPPNLKHMDIGMGIHYLPKSQMTQESR